MNYAEAKHRIIRKLPDDFFKDDDNRVALDIMENLFDVLDKDDVQPIDYMMCADVDMAIYILEFIKQGYAKNHQDAGVKKYLAALQMGIDAMRKSIPQKTKKIPYMYGAENRCPTCNHFVGWEYGVRIKFCDECGQALDWSKG